MMTRKIYVVFPDTSEDPIAAFTVRKDAEDACDYLDTISADEHFIADLAISETLADFMFYGDTMTTTEQNRDRKRRIRAAEGLGLTHVQLWVEPDDLKLLQEMKDHTEQMIDAETKRRHPDGGDT